MADMGGEAAGGFVAKAGAAGASGALWGIFASTLLVVPAIAMSVTGPMLNKARKLVEAKVDKPTESVQASSGKRNKSQREHERKMAELQAEQAEAELQMQLEALRKKKRKSAPSRSNSAHVI
jgi:hypothetical protein